MRTEGETRRLRYWLALGHRAFWTAFGLRLGGDEPSLRLSSLLYHQACEYFFAAVLAVHPHVPPLRRKELREARGTPGCAPDHDLWFLRSLASEAWPPLVQALPLADESDRKVFTLLNRAYVKARYETRALPLTYDQLGVVGGMLEALLQAVQGLEEDPNERREAACHSEQRPGELGPSPRRLDRNPVPQGNDHERIISSIEN